MEKVIGIILLGLAAAAVVYIAMHFNQFNKMAVPVPEKIIKLFKVEPFKQ